MEDIYNDGTYIENNPDLHEGESDFKFDNFRPFLDGIELQEKEIKILDVGGGAGKISFLVAEYFKKKGYEPKVTAYDLSAQMLEVQKQNNPYIVETVQASIEEIEDREFDLTLMIDVIEHIKNYREAARRLGLVSRYIVYNIPIEINFIDLLRNVYKGGKHYPMQTKTLGHLHFFSWGTAKRFLLDFYETINQEFIPYCDYLLESDLPQYVELRKSKIRNVELKASAFLNRVIPVASKYFVQGSMYSLVKKR